MGMAAVKQHQAPELHQPRQQIAAATAFSEKAAFLADFHWKKLRFQVWCAGFFSPRTAGGTQD